MAVTFPTRNNNHSCIRFALFIHCLKVFVTKMGPKTAAKVVEKVAPKDEAQVCYVNVKVTAPAPIVAPPLAASASASIVSGEPHASAPPKSPKKQAKKEEVVPVEQAAPVAPVADEMQEVSFEIIANLLCRTDIVVDYIRRQTIKVIQDKLAAEDPEKKIGEALRTKLKTLQTDLGNKTSADLVLRDTSGADIVFKEVSPLYLEYCSFMC